MARRILTFAGLLALTLAAPAAQAQITSPPPAGTTHLYTVPGVVNAGNLATYLTCTSVSTASQTITVDVFSQTGASAGSATSVLGAGKSMRFGTQASPALLVDTLITTTPVASGVARIVSTDKKLLCTAAVADATSGSPVMAELTIVAKLKQKAAN